MDYAEIDEEIERLQNGSTNYSNCEKLAILYTIRDHAGIGDAAEVSHTPIVASNQITNAILNGITDKGIQALEEHFDAIELLYPREAKRLLNRLTE